jgi:nitrite reductase/ring-hydroxylating ferredoxin subunit
MAQVSIGSLSDFPEGTPTFAEADGTRLCIVRVGDTVHAICDDCPHAEASLSEGDFLAEDMAVECPAARSTSRRAIPMPRPRRRPCRSSP